MTHELLGQTLGNRYQFDVLLGEGTFSYVFRITDLQRRATLAAKLLRRDIAHEPAFLERFQREAAVLSRLQHPHIVRYYDVIDIDEHLFILMDYIPGPTLETTLAQRADPLSPSASLRYLTPLMAALHFAHTEGIIHRDLKPANILIHENGTLYVTDFGIARLLSDSGTLTMGATIGTPFYISPEQATGQPVSTATDIYALGVLLYRMYTGQVPFLGNRTDSTGTTVERVIHKHVTLAPEPLTHLNPEIDLAVEEIVLRCLHKDPTRRFSSVSALHDAITEAIGVTPVSLETPVPPGKLDPSPAFPDMKLPEWSQFVAPVATETPDSVADSAPVIPSPSPSQAETDPHLSEKFVLPETEPHLEQQLQRPPDRTLPCQPSSIAPPAYRPPEPRPYVPPPPATTGRSRPTGIVAVLIMGILLVLGAACAASLYLLGAFDGSDPERSTTALPDVTATVQTSPSPDATATATMRPRGGTHIAFDSRRSGDLNIYVMNVDGSDVQELTGSSGAERGPSWSPDGTRIAFYGAASEQSNYDIYVVNSDGSDLRNLTNSPDADDRYPTWSPDGTRIAFHSDANDNFDIYIINTDGTGLQPLLEGPAQELGPDWSPDGTHIVFHTDRWGYPYEIGVVNVTTRAVERLTDSDDTSSFPTWSPDGAHIAYNVISATNQSVNLYIMRADGSDVRALTTTPDRDAFPDWSPDGTQIIYQHGLEGVSELRAIPVAGGEPRSLTERRANFLPEWEPIYQ